MPPKLKLLRGTKRQDKRGAEITASALPPPPAWLPPRAKEEYEAVTPALVDAGLVTGLDLGVLVTYALALSQVAEATECLVSQDLGEAERSRWFRHWIRSAHLVIKAAGELGLSPMGRLRLHISLGREPQSELERFLDSNEEGDPE